MVLRQQLVKVVATGNPAFGENVLDHEPQLVAADTDVFRTYLSHSVQHFELVTAALSMIRFRFVIGLSGTAKQFAGSLYRQALLLAQSLYCLAPDFFLMGYPCSSAMSISVLSALTCILAILSYPKIG